MDTNFSLSDMAAACGNCNGNNQWNNPMWLIWAILFGRNGGFFGNNGEGVQAAEIQGKLNALSNQMQDSTVGTAVLWSIPGVSASSCIYVTDSDNVYADSISNGLYV